MGIFSLPEDSFTNARLHPPPPAWWDHALVPCRCNSTNRVIRQQEVSSDGAILRVKCDDCASEWCVHIEG